VLFTVALCGGCAAQHPFESAPPSASRPWKSPELANYSAALAESERGRAAGAVSVDPQKTYQLSELIDIAQRTNPETRVAWERARQAALVAGLAEGTYYPTLAAAATGAYVHLVAPIPTTVDPNLLLTANTQFFIPTLSLEWLLLDFGRRRAGVDAAQAQVVEATAGFNAKHQQIVFNVTRDFYTLTAVRGKAAAERAALDAARSLEEAAVMRRQHQLATLPEVLQAQEGTAQATYELEDALATEHDARMALLESIGIRPGTPIEIADVSQEPLPPASRNRWIKPSTERWPAADLSRGSPACVPRRCARRAPTIGRNWRHAQRLQEHRAECQRQSDDSVDALLYDVGFRFEWTLFEGFERRNKAPGESLQREAERIEHKGQGGSRSVEGLQRHQGRAGQAASGCSVPGRRGEGVSYLIHTRTVWPSSPMSARQSAIWHAPGRSTKPLGQGDAGAAFAFSTGDLARR
jgi:hypothetical protein